ncbi:MAG: hypothetical protein ACRCYZ_02065 [Alphaproteobacteria bacterium]
MFSNIMNFGNNPFDFQQGALMPAGTGSNAMPSVTELGMQAMQPNYSPSPQDMVQLGAQAQNNAPVMTDSSNTVQYGGYGGESGASKFDMSGIMNTVKKVLSEQDKSAPRVQFAPAQSTAGGRYDNKGSIAALQMPKPLADYAAQYQNFQR